MRAVLLDAFGTLLDLPDPVPRLQALLADSGHWHTRERVAGALRAEIAFYRANHDRGRDPRTLADLRQRCAAVLSAALDGEAPATPRLAEILIESLRFELFPDVLPALDALADAGLPLAVVSNWDSGLADVLARLGIADRFVALAVSALVGVRKPDPAIFQHALARLGVAPAAALHCGDGPEPDCRGASRAGIAAVLIDRSGVSPGGQCPSIHSLTDLALLTGF